MTFLHTLFDKLPINQRKKRRRQLIQRMLVASIGFGIVLMGLVAGYYLSSQQFVGDIRQRASSDIQPNSQNQVAGFNCSGTRCNLATTDWCGRVCIKYNNIKPSECVQWDYNGEPKADGTCSNGGGYVNCAPTHKAVKFYCPEGLNSSNKCFGTSTRILQGQIVAGGSVDLAGEMQEKCGAYQFDFSDEASPDASGNCGAVTYVWPKCGSTPGDPQSPPPVNNTPTPTPAPACTVFLVKRVDNQNVRIGDTIRMKVGETATLRARVQNITSPYEVDYVTFRSQNTSNAVFFPNEPTLDQTAPYDGTFRVVRHSSELTRLRARVRLKVKSTGQTINSIVCETHVFLAIDQPTPTPSWTPRPTNTPTPTPSFSPTPSPSFTPTPTPSFSPTPSPSFTPTPTPIAGCNSPCNLNADCSNSQHICVEIAGQRICRLQSNIFSATCSSATPTPTPTSSPTPMVTKTPGLPEAGNDAVSNIVVITAGLGVLILGSLALLLLL